MSYQVISRSRHGELQATDFVVDSKVRVGDMEAYPSITPMVVSPEAIKVIEECADLMEE